MAILHLSVQAGTGAPDTTITITDKVKDLILAPKDGTALYYILRQVLPSGTWDDLVCRFQDAARHDPDAEEVK
jgi:hypothetical protein